MHKKAIGGHVDWIIGIGLFLVYVALLFAFFKPGVQDVFDGDSLLDIVEEEFREDTAWNLSKTPLFITALDDYHCWTGPPSPSDVTPAYDYQVAYFHLDGLYDQESDDLTFPGFAQDFSSTSGYEIFYVPSSDDEDVCTNFVDVYAGEDLLHYCEAPSILERPYSVKFSEQDGLSVPTYFADSDVLKYVIISHDSSIGAGPAPLPNLVSSCYQNSAGDDQNHFLACRMANYDASSYDPYTYALSPLGEACFAQYSIGVSESLYGINSEIASPSIYDYLLTHPEQFDLAACGLAVGAPVSEEELYACAKTLWGYPPLKEFKVVVSYGGNEYEFPTNVIPYNVRVDSRLYNDFILTADGVRLPATVNLLVW